MGLEFDYYYGAEAEQFSFYKFPKILIKDEKFKGLSCEAKLLYGIMLDRMELSIKNGWFDSENRAFIIYSQEHIMEDLGCGKDKATKVVSELDEKKGIGLISKVKRGLGKPDIIYVKNFIVDKFEYQKNAELIEEEYADVQRAEKPTSVGRKNRFQEFGESDFRTSEISTSVERKKRIQEDVKTDAIYTNKNNTDSSDIESINQSEKLNVDRMDWIENQIDLIKENIEYNFYMNTANQQSKEMFQEIFDVICDVICVKREFIKIEGEAYPYELVKERLLRLNSSHIKYVIWCMKSTTTKIQNIKAYLITTLYNAPTTMKHFYQQESQYDFY